MTPAKRGGAVTVETALPLGGQRVLNGREWERIARRLALSPREIQIARLIFDEASEPDIATELGISKHTVHSHIRRIYRKLDVTSRGGVIVRILGEHIRQLRRTE